MSDHEKGRGAPAYEVSDAIANDKEYRESDLIEAAVLTGEEETRLSLKELFRIHGKAAMWSMLLSLALVMEGMDVGLVNNFFGQQAYLNKFGNFDAATNKYVIGADWQAGINNSQQAGAVIGLLLNGYCQSRFGSRRMYMISMVALTAAIFILVFAQNLPMLLVGNLLCGIPWGVFQTLTTAYAAEICPVAMRGYLTSWVSMCWGTGSFLAALILRATLGLPGDWAWRTPYILQWVWPVPLFVVGYFAPESPWWLIRKERYEDAEHALYRLAKPGHYTPLMMRQQIALMRYTNERQKIDAAAVTYWDCFRGVNLRRTEIACVVFALQVWSGQGICAYATVFLRAAGMAETMAFNYSMAIQSTNIFATGIAILLMGRFGRRSFYLFGLGTISVWQLIVGIFGTIPALGSSVSIAVAAMMILINLCFKLSLGPACYTIISEIPNTRIRPLTIVLARTTYILSNVICGQLIPRMLNAAPAGWGWSAKAGWFFLGTCFLSLLYTWFRIPETRNRTFLELDYMFQQRVPARQFRNYEIDINALAGGQGHGSPILEAVDEKKQDVEQIETAPATLSK